MSNYDFKMLNDKDFEHLVADLLSSELKVRVERFRPGKDKGVDGRFFSTPKQETIIQCKHWARSDVSALIRHLQKSERPKLVKLRLLTIYLNLMALFVASDRSDRRYLWRTITRQRIFDASKRSADSSSVLGATAPA